MKNDKQFKVICMDCFKGERKPLMFWIVAKCDKCYKLSFTINIEEWGHKNDTSSRVQATGTIIRRKKEVRYREDKRAKADFARQSPSVSRCVELTKELGDK